MTNTLSNIQAARFLSVHYNTYKRYAQAYMCMDDPTMTLFERQKLKNSGTGKGISKVRRVNGEARSQSLTIAPLQDILAGKRPNYNIQKLQKRLIDATILQPRCANCGYSDIRIIDNQYPLILHFKDGNSKNHVLENLELLCLNCWFVYVGDIPRMGRKKWVKPSLLVDSQVQGVMKKKLERFEDRINVPTTQSVYIPSVEEEVKKTIPVAEDSDEPVQNIPNPSEHDIGLTLSDDEYAELQRLASGAIKD